MQKPAMPNMPGISAMTETMDFVKNLWGGMSAPGLSIPGMVMPTLSVEDIDKQVKDLKAVESWLTVNMTMLRGTIQALEVQSATITTLKSMGQTLSAAVTPMASEKAAPARPFGAAAKVAADEAEAEQAAADKAEREDAAEKVKADARRKSREAMQDAFKSNAGAPNPAASVASDAQAANPALWWNMLQDQFKQAVSTAMTPEAGAKPARKSASPAAAKPAPAKPVAKKAAVKRKAL